LECSCFCVESVTLEGDSIEHKFNAQAEFSVTIKGRWKATREGNVGGMPTVEWFEKFTAKPQGGIYDGLAIGQWHDMYDVAVTKGGQDIGHFRDVNPKTATKKAEYVMTDKPGAAGVHAAAVRQAAKFAIRVQSTPGCDCGDDKGKTVYATHDYAVGGHHVEFNRFSKPGFLPGVPPPKVK
jgi:hypothetical protein